MTEAVNVSEMMEKVTEDGIEYSVLTDLNGTRVYFLYGLLHRENGPAVEGFDGTREWWLNGEKLTEEEFSRKMFLSTN